MSVALLCYYMRGHFGCIFKGTEEYTTGVWWTFYMRILGTYQWPLCDLGGEKKNPGHPAHGNGHGHVRVYARLRHIEGAMHGPY